MITTNNETPFSINLLIDLFKLGDTKRILEFSTQLGFFQVKDQHGKNPFHLACFYGYSELINTFLQINKSFSINSVTNQCETPLHLAVQKNHLDIVSILLKNGAKTSLPDNSGDTPLHLASKNNNIDTINLLIHYGSDIHAKNNDGKIPFHLASKIKTIQLFLDHNVNIHSPSGAGNTLLHLTSSVNNVEATNFLISKNTNINNQNKYGYTPLHLAATFNNIDTVTLLLNAKANTSLKCKYNKTALDLAIEKKLDDIVQVFDSIKNYQELNQSIPIKNTQERDISKKMKL